MTAGDAMVARRHPIRALLWGFLVGIGVSVYLTLVFPVIVLDSIPGAAIKMAVVAVVVAVVMMLLTVFVLPPRKPKGVPPARRTAAAPPAGAAEGDTIVAAGEEAPGAPDHPA